MDSFASPGPEGAVRFLSFEGTSFECGEQLGASWRPTLRRNAQLAAAHGWTPWWWKGRGGEIAEVVDRVAPHLVDLYRGMAQGARIDEERCTCAPIAQPLQGCTSFSVDRRHTLDGHAMCGQTKDTAAARKSQYQVLRLSPSDAPRYLTLTYPGELFGHGFASPGMSVFRNALYVSARRGGTLPFDAVGLLANYATCLHDVIDMTSRHRVRLTAHVTVTDTAGRSIGLETAGGEVEVIWPRDGIYIHAKHTVCSRFRARVTTGDLKTHRDSGSEHRQSRLHKLIDVDRGRLTSQLMFVKLSDHANYPASLGCHRGRAYQTTAAVVAAPSRGYLHVALGNPSRAGRRRTASSAIGVSAERTRFGSPHTSPRSVRRHSD